MKIVIGNTQSSLIIGGKDNLLGFSVIDKMRDYMRVRPEGYYRSPKYQRGFWDGWRYFMTPGGVFATGFLGLVYNYAVELGIEVELQDSRENLPELKEEFTTEIGIINGDLWTGFDYQVEMAKKLTNYIKVGDNTLYFPRGILDCATNAGKTSIAALIIKNYKERYNTVFVVSTETIFNQAVSLFSQVIGEPVGQVKSGKFDPKWFTVVMVKTLGNRLKDSINAKKLLNDAKVLFVDESDESGADEYAKVLAQCDAGMRIFMSGTPLDSKSVNNMVCIGLSGVVLGRITNKFLIDNGYSQKPLIHILLNRSLKEWLTYDTELRMNVHTSESRAELMCSEIIDKHPGKSIVVTFDSIEHGYFMLDKFSSRYPDIEIGILEGKTKDRESVLTAFKERRTKILLCSMVIKRGANIPQIDVLVLGQGGKGVSKIKQLLGRGLRKKDHDDVLHVYDFHDTGKHLSKHSAARVRLYKKEEMDVNYTFEQKRGYPV